MLAREFKSIVAEHCQKENIKVSLFLDEIDEILNGDKLNGEPLFRTFRSLSQEGYLDLIIAGYETLFIATKDIKSRLFNFLEVIRLGQLDYKSAAQLIVEPMGDFGIDLQNVNLCCINRQEQPHHKPLPFANQLLLHQPFPHSCLPFNRNIL